jgi:KDO2-lipid IV(A) lauroyltransferase
MITLFLFACVWICTAKGLKVSGPMTYVFFAFLIFTAIFRVDSLYLLPIAAVYMIFAIYGVFAPWPSVEAPKHNRPKRRFLKHPFELFSYRIMKSILFFVPLPALSWLGGAVLGAVGPHIRVRQDAMRKNLEMTIPECANDKFMKRVWNNWGRAFVEGLKFPAYCKNMNTYVTFRNKNKLYEHPQFLLSLPHFGYMGLMALGFRNSGLKLTVTYKKAVNPLTNDILLENYGYGNVPEATYVPVGNAIPMIRAIKNGEILTVNSDQRVHGTPYIDFMGVPARTSTGIARLARQFNLPILIAHVERTRGFRHEIVFDEFVNVPHTDNAEADEINGMKLVNDAMGRVIKNKPDEYLWIHRRWS